MGAVLLVGALSTLAMAATAPESAGAALLGPVSVTPASGPPGTIVTVSGTDCTPGLLVNGQDYALVTSVTLLPSALTLPVQANGSWQGSFAIPGSAPAIPAIIVAACFSDGLPSLLSTYAPQTFSVTAPPAPTTTPPTTTPPAGGGTGAAKGGGSGATGGGSGSANAGGSGSGGAHTDGAAGGDRGAIPSAPATSAGAGAVTVGNGLPVGGLDARTVESADASARNSAGLASPRLAGDVRDGAEDSLAGLGFILILVLSAALATLMSWLRFARGRGASADPDAAGAAGGTRAPAGAASEPA